MRKDKFKKMIQKFELNEPKTSFTNNIMDEIMVSNEYAKSKEFDQLLQKAIFVNPKKEFTNNVMNQIIPQKQIAFEPIISKKTRIQIFKIASILIVLVVLTIFFTEKITNIPSKFNGYFSVNNLLIIEIFKQNTILFMSLLSIFALLVLDLFFRNKVNNSRLVRLKD
jgi:hypothetical protein